MSVSMRRRLCLWPALAVLVAADGPPEMSTSAFPGSAPAGASDCGCSTMTGIQLSIDPDVSVVQETGVRLDDVSSTQTVVDSEETCSNLLAATPSAKAYSYQSSSGSCVLSALSHWTPDPEFSGGAKAEVFPELCGLKCQALQDVDVAAINVGHHNPITCQCCLNYRVNYAASKNRYYRCAGAVCTECSNSPGPGLSSDVTASASSSWNHWSGWCSLLAGVAQSL